MLSCKNGCSQESKKGMLKTMRNKDGQPRSAVDGFKIFDNDEEAAKHYCVLATVKVILAGNSIVLWSGHHYQKF